MHSKEEAKRRVSIVIPLYNEQDNVQPLVEDVHQALDSVDMLWELVIVDDGSLDETVARLHHCRSQKGEHLRVVELSRNYGQTAALQAGIDCARGEVVVTMDGDLQNDPRDIALMVECLVGGDLDVVVGWRLERKDGLFLRRIPSVLANRLISKITRVHLHDYGCTLKAFRTSILRRIRLYGEMHRFIPVWLAMNTNPNRIGEQVVRHHERRHGKSKYGIGRTFRVLLDLLSVYFFLNYSGRPGHFFGGIGILSGIGGGVILAYLGVLKLFGESIGSRPLLLLGILLVVVGVQFLSTGIVAEMLSRTYFGSGAGSGYIVRNSEAASLADSEGWCFRRQVPKVAPGKSGEGAQQASA